MFPSELETTLCYLSVTITTDTSPTQKGCNRKKILKFDNFSHFQNVISNNFPPASVFMTHCVRKPIWHSSIMLKFTERPKTLGITFKKHGFLGRESSICRWFSCVSRWSKRWYGSICKEMELDMDCLISRIFLQKASSYKCQFCTKVCSSSRLVSQV